LLAPSLFGGRRRIPICIHLLQPRLCCERDDLEKIVAIVEGSNDEKTCSLN
jgi:hypothetical protein